MYVIGTSGHVDHGKTLLIEALTGINADRLPEEKERGMTIDLGFAHYRSREGEIIGVVDVPGHERFIKNMVAGAWGLDCALLTVAADDGWMQQTEDHAWVLKYLKVPIVLLVITKTDLVSPEVFEVLREEVSGEFRRVFEREPKILGVSAKSGKNIEELKDLIYQELRKNEIPKEKYPYLYLDRIFSKKGSGVIVTGTLKGSALNKEDNLLVFPIMKEVKVRSLQAYYFEVDSAEPSCRVALNITGVKKEELKRGYCLSSRNSQFQGAMEIIAYLYNYEGKENSAQEYIKNHKEIEIAAGTWNCKGVVHFLGTGNIARIILSERFPMYWNQPFCVLQPGGSSILGGGRVVWSGTLTKEKRIKFLELSSLIPSLNKPSDYNLLQLKLLGFIPLSQETRFPKSEKESIVLLGTWACYLPWLKDQEDRIVQLAFKPGGIKIEEVAGKLSLPLTLVKLIIARLINQERIKEMNSVLFPPSLTQSETLSSIGKNLVNLLKKNGNEGITLSKLEIPGAQKELRNLARLGIAVSLDGNLFYDQETYRNLKRDLLKGFSTGDRFSIPQGKDKIGLTRKYMIPLLNKLETEGFVKRDGDFRVVLKLP